MAKQQQTDEESRAIQNREQRSRGMQRQQSPGAGLIPFALGPFALIRRMQEDVDRLLGLSARGQGTLAPSGQGDTEWSPAIETFQRGNEFVIRAALPGLAADDVAVEIGEDAVTIRGERRDEHEEERDGVYISEFSYGAFTRVVPLPPGAITDNARAVLREGVLEIVVPAPSQEAQRGRRVEIEQGSNNRSEGARESEQASNNRSEAGREREQRRSQ
jgi:HSP20 family protein